MQIVGKTEADIVIQLVIFELPRELVGPPQIVRVEEGYQGRASVGNRQIPGETRAFAMRLQGDDPTIEKASLSSHSPVPSVHPVVDDKNLEILDCLDPDACNREWEKVETAIGRDYDRASWTLVHPELLGAVFADD